MVGDIASIKRSRAGTKQKLTRFRQYLEANDPNTGNKVELKTRLENAEGLLTEFNNFQDKIRELDVNEKLTEELNVENEVFEQLYFQAISKARRLVIPGNQIIP